MIEPQVEALYRAFVAEWSFFGEANPVLALDGSWPSLGAVDLICFDQRCIVPENCSNADVLREFDRRVKGVAAYIAVIAHKCWMAFGMPVEVGESANGIAMRVKCGSSLGEGEEFVVEVEKQLRTLFSAPPRVFPVLNGFSRPLSSEQTFLNLFGLGVATGLTPFGDGPWRSETPDTCTHLIEKAVRVLARSCAEYYERVFPEEKIGSVAELYLNELIYPPIFLNEDLPARQAAIGVVRFFKEYGFSTEQMLNVSHNLALFPDEIISLAGLACFTAISDGGISAEILAVARNKGHFVGLLRGAMLAVRRELGLRVDWSVEAALIPEDYIRIKLERLLGFLPWVSLPIEKIADRRLSLLVNALINFDYDDAYLMCASIAEEDPTEFDVRIQAASLDMLCFRFESALAKLKALLTEPLCEENPIIYNMLGMSLLSMGDLVEGEKMHARAFTYRNRAVSEASNIANDYSWALILQGKFEEALAVVDCAINGEIAPVTALLNRAYILNTKGRVNELREVEERLIKLAPTNYRVVSNYVLRK